MNNPAPLGKVQVTPTNTIHPAENNPRKITQAAIDMVANSLKRFGWQQPIIIDTNNTIIAGHTRHKAAQQLGLTNVPTITATNLTPQEADAYRIADNRTGDYTTWDYPQLVQQLENLADEFSEELALADWRGIIDEFETLYGEQEEATPSKNTDQPTNSHEYNLDPTTEAHMKNSFEITVVCDTADNALALELQLLDMEGVIDVRHKR